MLFEKGRGHQGGLLWFESAVELQISPDVNLRGEKHLRIPDRFIISRGG